VLSHANLLAQVRAWIAELDARAGDVWLSGQPLFHIGGINGLLPFIALGAPSILTATPSCGPRRHWRSSCRDRVPRSTGLIAFCRGRLAGFKKPSAVVTVDVLPRNAGGKVLKRELRDRFAGAGTFAATG
jgi:acyl-CoA synthetase (AMP-forming)/AMP-acid ligase II